MKDCIHAVPTDQIDVVKCDLPETYRLRIIEAFERTHPGRKACINKECPFANTNDMELCPFYQCEIENIILGINP